MPGQIARRLGHSPHSPPRGPLPAYPCPRPLPVRAHVRDMAWPAGDAVLRIRAQRAMACDNRVLVCTLQTLPGAPPLYVRMAREEQLQWCDDMAGDSCWPP